MPDLKFTSNKKLSEEVIQPSKVSSESDLIKKLEQIVGEKRKEEVIAGPEFYELNKEYNECLVDVKAKLPEIIKAVLEEVEKNDFIFGYREGNAFKQVSLKQLINSIK